MSAPVAFLTRDMELSDPIVKKFLNTFSGLPVVDKNRHVVGILSRKDVARFLAFSRAFGGADWLREDILMWGTPYCTVGSSSPDLCTVQ